MRRRLHRLSLSVLLTVGVIAWNQQQNQSFAHLPFSSNTQAVSRDSEQPKTVISDSELRALFRAAQPLRFFKRD
jgi:hypothetical protein